MPSAVLLGPSLIREFVNHVISNREYYSYNVKYRNHVVFDNRHFYEYLRMRGVDVEKPRASTLFASYILNTLDVLKERGVIKEYWTEKGSKKMPMRIHVIIAEGDA